MRARTPEAALAVVLRLLVAQRLADTDGLPNADRQGVYEPQELAASKVLDKLARRVAPPSVKRHLAEQEAERERREQAWRERAGGEARRAAREARRRRARPLRLLPRADRDRPTDAAEKHGSARPRRRLRAAVGQRHDSTTTRGGRLMRPIRPPDLLTSIARETQMHLTHKWVECYNLWAC